MNITVIGYGNIYRQDDGAGHALALQISQDLKNSAHNVTTFLDLQLLPEMVLDIKDQDVIIFTDARVNAGPDYEISEVKRTCALDGLNLHTVGPGWFLELLQKATGQTPRGIIVSVRGENFDFGEGVTDACKARINAAAAAFENLQNSQNFMEVL